MDQLANIAQTLESAAAQLRIEAERETVNAEGMRALAASLQIKAFELGDNIEHVRLCSMPAENPLL